MDFSAVTVYLCINADLFMKKIDLLGISFMIVNIAFELFTSRRALWLTSYFL